ncbi:uncharacterized protein LOC128119759 isoform X1 [Peromyscus californicus insignis]|uniref:uncharacterized protein LOC128108337 n=1 Tax=Peromyscus californicus insignis TaxID=564181 RepID=UPI0022A66F06|nr:uncharacterized protein LOC128108337 [Peromyscus californicus insignis]XP_052609245.1 uncharacterized protein LOC128119759 isoform X1 [Peromyscus californicus insignis]XP_052609246.1 uncharacterized protein LOC128119759 isoform X1 [Peromyscus californicus insignis]
MPALLDSTPTTNRPTTTPHVIQVGTRKQNTVATPTIYDLEGKLPLYWSAERRFTHYIGKTHSFWQKYAACLTYAWYKGCDQYRMALSIYHPNKEYMLESGDDVNTNIHEQNPLKCHYNELWTNITNHAAIYNMYWTKNSHIRTNTLRVNSHYRTNTMGIETEPEFDCELGMNSSFVRQYFAPVIAQQMEEIGMLYNKTSERWEEQVYNYNDDYYDGDYPASTTPKVITTPINPCNPMNWTVCNDGEMVKPWPVVSGIIPLPKPWGNRCPNNLWRYIQKHKLDVPGQNNTNWLCVADYPNLPFYGNFSVLYSTDNPSVKGKEWKWDDWTKILQLGVEHWRFPIILTDIIQQPWASMRHTMKPKYDCNTDTITHICILTVNSTLHREKHSFAYACINMSEANTNIRQNNNTKTIVDLHVGPLFTGRTSRSVQDLIAITDIIGQKIPWLGIFVDSTANITATKQVQAIMRFNDDQQSYPTYFTQASNLGFFNLTLAKSLTQGTTSLRNKLSCFTETNNTAVRTNCTTNKATTIINLNIYGKITIINKHMSLVKFDSTPILTIGMIHEPKHKIHNMLGGSKISICWFHESKDLLDMPIPWEVSANVTTDEVAAKNIFIFNRAIEQKAYNFTGIREVEYIPPYVQMTKAMRINKVMDPDDLMVHYKNGITRSGSFWQTLDYEMDRVIELQHHNLPYYFYMLMPNPQYKEWNKAEWVAHKPRGSMKSHTQYWDKIYYLPISRNKDFLSEHSNTPLIIFRGNMTRPNKENIGLYTAHFPKGYLIPPEGTPTVVKAPAIIPDLKSPAKLVLYPRIRKIEITIDLTALKPPIEYCSDVNFRFDLDYSSPTRVGRKPLQAMAVAAFMAGAILGGIMGGGVSAAMIEPIKAEIYHIQEVNKKTAEALAAISNSIDGMHTLIQTMQGEIKMSQDLYKEQFSYQAKLINTNHNMMMCQMYRTQVSNMNNELNSLFSTGLGRRTREYQSILNPEYESSCTDGLCNIHLVQIFLQNSFSAYHSKAIPQLYTERTGVSEWNHQYLVPIDHYLWTNMNDTPVYIPLEDSISLGANTYVYPHLPESTLETSQLAVTTITQSLEDTGDYTFLICAKYLPTLVSCINLNETTMNDDITTFNITESGCYMVHNCSILQMNFTNYDGKNITKQRVTTLTLEEKHYFDGSHLFNDPTELEHHQTFVKQAMELQHIADFNQKQLESIHNKIKEQDAAIHTSQAQTHNLVNLLRTNTYIHKDWAKQMQKCSFWDYLGRLVRLDLICTPIYTWWHWIKLATFWFLVILGISIALCLSKKIKCLIITPCLRCLTGIK